MHDEMESFLPLFGPLSFSYSPPFLSNLLHIQAVCPCPVWKGGKGAMGDED